MTPDALITVPAALILVAFILIATALLGSLYRKIKRERRNVANLHKRRRMHGL